MRKAIVFLIAFGNSILRLALLFSLTAKAILNSDIRANGCFALCDGIRFWLQFRQRWADQFSGRFDFAFSAGFVLNPLCVLSRLHSVA